MAWKQVVAEPKDVSAITIYPMVEGPRGKVNLLQLLNSRNRNFVVPLRGGELKTRKSILSESFNMQIQAGEYARPDLMSEFFSLVWEDNLSNISQKLSITAHAWDNQRKSVLCQVEVKQGENSHHDFRLVPVLPKELSKGREGVRVDGTRTREGIDGELNNLALVWSRDLAREFGIYRSKLDAKCVKSVCVEPRQIDETELVSLAEKQNLSINFSRKYENRRTLQYLEMSYRSGKLVVEGYNSGSSAHGWHHDMIYPACKMLNGNFGISVDLNEGICFEQYYRTEFSLKMSNFFGRVNEKVSAYLDGLEDGAEERKKMRDNKLVERLKEMGVGLRDDKDGAICIIQYDPVCLLDDSKGPTADPVKGKLTEGG